MSLYNFTDNGKSVTIQIDIQSIVIAKNVVDLVLVNDIDDKILEIRTNEYKYKDYEINVDTDTITGVGAGSTTATQLRDALLAIFFLDEGTTAGGLDNIIVVNQGNVSTTLGGIIDSNKEYFLDGIIDLGTTQITVPTTGITIRGYSFDISGLTSSEDNYTMFISESIAIGSGNMLGFDYLISVTGAGSKVYEIYDATGFNAFEFQRINYNDCTSLGDIYDYRQGLETGTGRFGGSPSLTLHGLWRGGFRITTSIVRSMSDTTTQPLFKTGTLFQMNSRFLTDINVDLGTLQPLLDFAPANFPNASTLQLKGCEITRDGSYSSDDANILPNILNSDLPSYFKGNNGISNTFVGGVSSVISEETTVVVAGSTYYDLEGVFLGTGLQHFSASADGKLTHLGTTPTEYEITAVLVLESTQNNDLTVRFRKWDNSAGVFINLDYTEQTRQVNNLQGGRDVANFTIIVGGVLDENDFLQLQARNNNGNNNITAETGSYFRVQER
tara:strand:- start:366 stop:1862 length:1497 start_codon:yes stop_codon:yes gene_type:complete